MIIDRTDVSGIRAYFEDPASAGGTNLGGAAGVVARTPALGKGRQWQVDRIHLVLEAPDLTPLFDRAPEPPGSPAPPPLFSVHVQKEMFPGLFADPFRHRVHNIAGFEDFKRGTFVNCKALEVDGIPTIVSLGTAECRWTSAIYEMPGPASFDHAAWELAASRLAPPRSFTYSLDLAWWAPGQPTTAAPTVTSIASSAPAARRRAADLANVTGVGAYRVEFSAKVSHDAPLNERHGAILGESAGRPLLRAVNLLEGVPCANDFATLEELLARSREHHLFEGTGAPPAKLWASLDFSATLVASPNQLANGPDDFEFIEIATQPAVFRRFQARLEAEELLRPVPA